ncbi:MAG: GNAT family N-acetyltransferase [Christensenellaceae bacterium]|nr:GNAT family N-acetyltransferase [Christensenellaceae bacterium]
MHSYTLETERLILRPLTVSDAEAAFVWLSDPEVNRFMPYNLYTEVEPVRQWIASAIQQEHYYLFGFVRKANGLLIGSGDVSPKDYTAAWVFGYNLRRDCWNQGYATEATRAMIDFAHREFGICDFQAEHAIANPASGRVMEKCGLVFDHFGEYSRFDGSETFPAKYYKLHIEDAP